MKPEEANRRLIPRGGIRRESIEQEVEDNHGYRKHTPEHEIGVLLRSSLYFGTDPIVLANFTGIRYPYVRIVAERFEKSKIWSNDLFNLDIEAPDARRTFERDVMVGLGRLVRTWSPEEQRFLYRRPRKSEL
jgi:hypothetical protein